MDLEMVAVCAVVALNAAAGVWYWRKGEYGKAKEAAAVFAGLAGLLAGAAAFNAYEGRDRTAAELLAARVGLAAATGAAERVMRQDICEAVQGRYDRQTAVVYWGGGAAAGCAVFLLALLAATLAHAAERGRSGGASAA
jgi:hypothetical protein